MGADLSATASATAEASAKAAVAPVICMITDRHRVGGEDMLVRRVEAAARAGVHLIQIRERDLDGGPLLRLVRRCVEVTRSTGARILVNDRVDIALSAGAHGVHLRGDSISATRLRSISPPGFIVGRSVHARVEAMNVSSAGGLDYLVFGPVFSTASKPHSTPAGVHALADVLAATPIPVLAIGGITRETLRSTARAGAAGFAAIGLFADGDDQHLLSLVSAASRAFDTPPVGP